MAARYRKIDPRIWTDEKFVQLSPSEKLIALYILSGQSNRIGLFVFSPGKAVEDLGLQGHAFRTAFVRVLEAFHWEWDEQTRVLYIRSWWKYNPPENANNVIGNLKDLADVPQNPFLNAFSSHLTYLDPALHQTFTDALFKRFPERFTNVLETFPERSTKPYRTQEQEQEQEEDPPTPQRGNGRLAELQPEQVQARWNLIPGVKLCQRLGPTICKRITPRLREHPEVAWWDDLLGKVAASAFLTGRTNGARGPFSASLNWAVRPTNLDKILAGDYDAPPQARKERIPL